MPLSNLNPFIRFAKPTFGYSMRPENRRCYDCRLFFITDGEGEIHIEGTAYNFSKNTAIYLPAGTRYQFKANNQKLDMMIFNFDLISDYAYLKKSLGTALERDFDPSKMPAYALTKEFASPILQKAPHLHESLKKCIDDFLTMPPYYREVCSARLKRCLLELLRFEHTEPESAVIKAITDYVHTVIRSKRIFKVYGNRNI